MSPYVSFVEAGVFGHKMIDKTEKSPVKSLQADSMVSLLTACSTFLSNGSSSNVTTPLEPENKTLQILHNAIF